MDIAQLRVIDAVARTGSVTAAAQELHYAQASVSHHLARIQEQLRAPVTRRRGRGIVLTPEGELLAGRAREILRRLDETESDVAALRRELQGRLRIAAFQSALLELVPPALRRVSSGGETIDLELRETHPDDALDLLYRNEVDVALVHRADDGPIGGSVNAVKLYDDPVYLLSTTPDDTVERHSGSNWIAGCDRCRVGIEDLCRTAGFFPRVGLRTEDIHVQASFVAAGLGVLTMPGTALRSLDMSSLAASRIPGAHRRVWAVTRDPETGLAHDFVRAVRMTVRALEIEGSGDDEGPGS